MKKPRFGGAFFMDQEPPSPQPSPPAKPGERGLTEAAFNLMDPGALSPGLAGEEGLTEVAFNLTDLGSLSPGFAGGEGWGEGGS